MVDFSFVNGGQEKQPEGTAKNLGRDREIEPTKSSWQPINTSASKQLDIDYARQHLTQYEAKVDGIIDQAQNFEVKDEATATTATEMVAQLRTLRLAITKASDDLLADANAYRSFVLGIKKVYTTKLENCEKHTNTKLNSYAYHQEMERRKREHEAAAAQAKLQAELNKKAKKDGTEAPVIEAPVIPEKQKAIKTEIASSKASTFLNFEITDLSSAAILAWILKQSADDYKKLAEKTIRKLIKAGITEGVEGVRFFEDVKATVRRK